MTSVWDLWPVNGPKHDREILVIENPGWDLCPDQGLCLGAGDENRTRTVSLGIVNHPRSQGVSPGQERVLGCPGLMAR